MDPDIKDFVKSQVQNESITKPIGDKKEFGEIKYQLSRYNSIKKYWASLFKKYRVRIFLSWNKFDNTHMAISDAMDSVGGSISNLANGIRRI